MSAFNSNQFPRQFADCSVLSIFSKPDQLHATDVDPHLGIKSNNIDDEAGGAGGACVSSLVQLEDMDVLAASMLV